MRLSVGVLENGVTDSGLVSVSGVARKISVGPRSASVEKIRISDDAPVARKPTLSGVRFWIRDSKASFEMKYLSVSVSCCLVNVCDEMKRSGRKRARMAAVDVSLAVVSTS